MSSTNGHTDTIEKVRRDSVSTVALAESLLARAEARKRRIKNSLGIDPGIEDDNSRADVLIGPMLLKDLDSLVRRAKLARIEERRIRDAWPAFRDELDAQRREQKAIQAEKSKAARTWHKPSLLDRLLAEESTERPPRSPELRRLDALRAAGALSNPVRCWHCGVSSFNLEMPAVCPSCSGLLDYESWPIIEAMPAKQQVPPGICTHQGSDEVVSFDRLCWRCEAEKR